MSKHHTLKLWPEFFRAKVEGLKPWEHRSTDDRAFAAGDSVTFQEWDPSAEAFTGQELGPVRITYVHEDGPDSAIFTHTMPQQAGCPVCRAIGLTRPGSCKELSHVTPAMAVRALGRSRTYVDKLVLARKVETETHLGTKLIPMAEIIRLKKEQEDRNPTAKP